MSSRHFREDYCYLEQRILPRLSFEIHLSTILKVIPTKKFTVGLPAFSQRSEGIELFFDSREK